MKIVKFSLLIFILTSCATTYPGRYIAWNFIDFDDYKHYDKRMVMPGDSPSPLQENSVRWGEMKDRFATLSYETEEGMDESSFEEILESNNTVAFMILEKGSVIYETYSEDYDEQSTLPTFSISKSIISTLTGFAIEEGHIGSVEDLVVTYIPELEGKVSPDLTIHHLLTMSSGFDFELMNFKPSSLSSKAYMHPDLRELILDPRMERPPGEVYNYDNFNTQLVGLILERTTGMSVSRYTEEKLWKPMGAESEAFWNLDSEKNGFETMSYGFNATLRDYARFALLFTEESFIPEQWIATSALTDWNQSGDMNYYEKFSEENKHGKFYREKGGYYSYFWWGIKKDGIPTAFFAYGMLDQFIFIYPEKELIILRFGDGSEDVQWWPDLFMTMAEQF